MLYINWKSQLCIKIGMIPQHYPSDPVNVYLAETVKSLQPTRFCNYLSLYPSCRAKTRVKAQIDHKITVFQVKIIVPLGLVMTELDINNFGAFSNFKIDII